MADWSLPITTTLYTLYTDTLNGKLDDCAKMFDGSSSTNLPTGTYRIDGTSANILQTWNGSAWNSESLSLTSLTVLASAPNIFLESTAAANNTALFFKSTAGNESIIYHDGGNTRLVIQEYTANTSQIASQILVQESGHIVLVTGGVDGNSADTQVILAGATGAQVATFYGSIDISPIAGYASLHLDAVSGSGSVLYLNGDGNTRGVTSFDIFQNIDTAAYVWQRGNASLLFGADNALAMTIDASQNIVMEEDLHVEGDMTAGNILYGSVNSIGTVVLGNSGFTVSSPSDGIYELTHTLGTNFGNSVMICTIQNSSNKTIKINPGFSSTKIEVIVTTGSSGSEEDAAWHFMVIVGGLL